MRDLSPSVWVASAELLLCHAGGLGSKKNSPVDQEIWWEEDSGGVTWLYDLAVFEVFVGLLRENLIQVLLAK